MLCTSQDRQVERRGRAVTARLGGGPQFLRPVAPVIASSSRWPTVRNQGNAPARASGPSSPPTHARRRSPWGMGCGGIRQSSPANRGARGEPAPPPPPRGRGAKAVTLGHHLGGSAGARGGVPPILPFLLRPLQ